jgi:hypothetical protein
MATEGLVPHTQRHTQAHRAETALACKRCAPNHRLHASGFRRDVLACALVCSTPGFWPLPSPSASSLGGPPANSLASLVASPSAIFLAGGPKGLGGPCKRWGARLPTLWKGLQSSGGRPDSQNDRSPNLNQINILSQSAARRRDPGREGRFFEDFRHRMVYTACP